jgi:hypothetical protein
MVTNPFGVAEDHTVFIWQILKHSYTFLQTVGVKHVIRR